MCMLLLNVVSYPFSNLPHIYLNKIIYYDLSPSSTNKNAILLAKKIPEEKLAAFKEIRPNFSSDCWRKTTCRILWHRTAAVTG